MFDGYRDAEIVGEGGLGRVYRAVRTSTGGEVAIKELREVPSASPAWHRAKRELEAMLRLKGHPYVVSVEEIIDGPNGPCLVMEYLDGGSLMDRLVQGPLLVPELVLIGQQVCQALADAHAAGIVHRDIKPHNLLVGSFGQVKVADFGIAALARGVGLHTRTQAFTLAYASPEELDGDAQVGSAADAYSFAATISHLATGRKPSFRDHRVTTDLKELESRHPALIPVVASLRRCLETDPALRPTMRDLHQTFATAMSQLGSDAITRLPRGVTWQASPGKGTSTTGTVAPTVVKQRGLVANPPNLATRDDLGADDEAATIIRPPATKLSKDEPTPASKVAVAAGPRRLADALRTTANLAVVSAAVVASIALVANGLLVLLKLI